jgi:hypothetical protein
MIELNTISLSLSIFTYIYDNNFFVCVSVCVCVCVSVCIERGIERHRETALQEPIYSRLTLQ